ncbi:uncharacterized protein LOC119688066 [Teleopsis dalmanni]|uniref:uncharacterized protein LOC119688066 n=1 Tax=Teleopsis dalmanni TaxID=139649 RepID=UPI0018CE5C05|nr:uncharacterized protein LOC119688066 [Teleopsis dalmanni]
MAALPESCANGELLINESDLKTTTKPNEIATNETATVHCSDDTEPATTTTMNKFSIQSACSAEDVKETNTDYVSMEINKPDKSLNSFPADEIPEPIKVLDDIISEFEESAKPVISNGENQSEDDGYMSLSRKNERKKSCEELPQTEINSSPLEVHKKNISSNGIECPKKNISKSTDSLPDQNIFQTTLPKVKPTVSTNYSSLPCCGARSSSVDSKIRDNCNGERNKLGIDISAVHNAVLRGGFAKLPEPILNEHPVTIYPGRYSPPTDGNRANRPQRLISSVQKHKEVCHILNPVSSISSTSSSSSNSTSYSDNKTNGKLIKEVKVKSKNDKKKYNCADEDDYSEDSLDDQSLSPLSVSNQQTPSKQMSIAWEISFKDSKIKSKLHPHKKHARESAKFPKSHSASHRHIVEQPYVDQLPTATKLEHGKTLTNNLGPSLYLDDFEDDSSTEKLNCMYRHSNMLGKGTFIIRRATKKSPPKAVDIFKSTQQYSESESSTRSEDNDESSINEVYDEPDPIKQMSAPLKSPRERLSLNIEPHHQNAFQKDTRVSPLISSTATPPDGFTKLLTKEMSRDADVLLSTEEESSHDDSSSRIDNFDIVNSFAYKNSNNAINTNNNSAINKEEFKDIHTTSTTPHTDLAPTLEEDEEQYSDFSYSCAPLKQIENNISALLRGEIAVVRVGDVVQPKRTLEFRPGVHKSESAKEMLLSQNAFGPLPPSPPSSNPDLFDYDALPPLPPSPTDIPTDGLPTPYAKTTTTAAEIHNQSPGEEIRTKDNKSSLRRLKDDLPLSPPTFENIPPAVPPHRGHSVNTIKSWSIDSNYRKKSPKILGYGSGITTPTGSQMPTCEAGGYSTKRYVSYGTKRSLKQSPREEHRLQTSCSLPETPIFARGCDIPRTPYRRLNENTVSGSRTAPRSSTSHSINMGNSIVGISAGSNYGTGMCRQRSMNHALASNEMLRLSGVPARGWYPKQRSMRPASTENIDRLSSVRVWDSAAGMSGTGHSRKPLTLPPNLTPSFLNKSPREALRRVTSLLITKKKNTKERKNKPPYNENTIETPPKPYETGTCSSAKDASRGRQQNTGQQKLQKKKGLFKSFWKKTKHFSLDQ